MRLVAMLVGIATLLALVGCTAESSWRGHAGGDSWTTPPGIPVQLRVSKIGNGVDGQITVVALPPTSPESPTGPAVAGTRIPITLQGVACEVSVLGRVTYVTEKTRSTTEEIRRPSGTAGTRTSYGIDYEIRCGDQPVPGTDASLRGARSRTSTAWGALILAIAAFAGGLADRSRLAAAVVVGALAFIGGAALGVFLFDGVYRVTYPILFVALALAGVIGMRGDSLALRITMIAGAAIGTAIAALIWPLWSSFGPIAGLVFAALVAGIGVTVVTLKS